MIVPNSPSATGHVRPDVIAAWTEALVAGEIGMIQAEFRSHGARGPQIVWNPAPETLQHAPMRFLLEHWRDLAGARPMPLAREIDALALRPALGFVSLLDVEKRDEAQR